MAVLTKNRLPTREYQVWASGVAGVAANMTAGEILDVYGSLGNRVADSVTLTSTAGNGSMVRFNVVEQVHAEPAVSFGGQHNSFVGLGKGSMRKSPYMVTEVEAAMPSIYIANGTTQTWTKDEIGVRDIRVVNASGLRITVT